MVDAKEVRALRAEEQWERYDTICVGRGASRIAPSWFETFADFVNADSLVWGDGTRTRTVGTSYCNQSGDAEDWAQRVYQSGIDFEAPSGFLGFEDVGIEAGLMQQVWIRDLPEMMAVTVTVQDLDAMLLVPAGHMPSAAGVSGQSMNGAGFLVGDAGQRGTGDMRNTWTWPRPLDIPAKSKLAVSARIDSPIKEFLRGLDTIPTAKNVVIPAAPPLVTKTVEYRNWYRIRVWHRGPRFVQLRGARSAG